jgi:hypothetical protein
MPSGGGYDRDLRSRGPGSEARIGWLGPRAEGPAANEVDVDALVHDSVYGLITTLGSEVTYPSVDQVRCAADRTGGEGRHAAVARLGTTYFQQFRSPALEYAGAALVPDPDLPGLVMRTADGDLWIDLPWPGRPGLDVGEVVADLLTAGTCTWDRRFRGVRVCILQRPQLSLLYLPDGRCIRIGTDLGWLIGGER